MKEFHPIADLFPLLEGEAFEELVADIKANGLRETIWLHADGRILDGRNRYRACLKAKVQPRFNTYGGQDPLAFVWSENFHRRHLTSSQRAVAALKLEEIEASLAKERMAQGGRGGIISTPSPGKAREKAASFVGTNSRYISDAKRIQREAPELIDDIRYGRMSIPEAKRVHRQQKHERQITEKAAQPIEPAEQAILDAYLRGRTVVINMNVHAHLLRLAQRDDRLVRIDRFTEWGNPFLVGEDGTRDECVEGYIMGFFPYKKSLHSKLVSLKGKALACHCHPERCHGDFLKNAADQA